MGASPNHTEASPHRVRGRRTLIAALGLGLVLVLGVVAWHGVFVGTTTTVTVGRFCGPVPTGGEVSWDTFEDLVPQLPQSGGPLQINRRWGQTTRYTFGAAGHRTTEHVQGLSVAHSCS
jgi:hypothetical protein